MALKNVRKIVSKLFFMLFFEYSDISISYAFEQNAPQSRSGKSVAAAA